MILYFSQQTPFPENIAFPFSQLLHHLCKNCKSFGDIPRFRKILDILNFCNISPFCDIFRFCPILPRGRHRFLTFGAFWQVGIGIWFSYSVIFSLHFPHFFPNGASPDSVTFCHRIQKTYTNCCILWRSGKLGILHVCIISPSLPNFALSICSNSPPSSFAPFVEISPITSPKASHCIPQSIPLKDHLCITIRISFRILLVIP